MSKIRESRANFLCSQKVSEICVICRYFMEMVDPLNNNNKTQIKRQQQQDTLSHVYEMEDLWKYFFWQSDVQGYFGSINNRL